MAIALVPGAVLDERGNTNGFTTGSIDSTGGDLILVSVGSYASQTAPALTDSKGNSYTGLTERIYTAFVRNRLFYCASPTVGSGHTFTLTQAGSYPSLAVAVFSGAHATPFDVQNGVGDVAASTVQPGSVTPSEDNELIVTGVSWYSGAGIPTSIDLSFVVAAENQAEFAVNIASALAYLIETTAAAKNPQWTLGSSELVAATIATFKAAAASGYVPSRLHMSGGALPMTGGLFQ